MMRFRQDGGGEPKGSGPVHGYTQTDGYNFGHYGQLIRELRMEDRPLFFNYMRMEPLMFEEILNRVSLESKRVTPTSGKHLHQA